MSFVYIDSQGREVKIPTVDAVRLRIELGAIKDQTRFFDSNTGKWAPAAEHEIYRTLKRQLIEAEQGFVAPPPTSVLPDGSPVSGARSPAGVEDRVDDPGVAGGSGPVPEDAEPEDDAESPTPDFGGLAGLEVAPAEDAPSPGPTAEPAPGGSDGDPDADSFVTSAEDELLGGLDDHGAGALDEGALDLEPSLAESFLGATDGGPTAEPPQEPPSPWDEEPTPDPEAGWSEAPQAASGAAWPGDPEPGAAASESGAESDPFDAVWDSPEDHGAGSSPASFDAAGVPAHEDLPPAPEPVPRSGAAPPQRKLTRARTPGADRIVGIVALVAVVGAVVFFGGRFLASSLGSGEPEITMPALDRELVPRMRQLAGRASGRMAQDMLSLPEARAVPEEPSEDWLAGIYLAGASQYPNVPAYWSAIRDWVEAARASENALFREALLAQLDTANLTASDSVAIRDRALAGFQAAGADRRVVYDQLQEVAERSVVLHEFLLANEDLIEYEPAGSGISRDPVLEAVPATEALGDEMWEMVGSITDAMDALGYLDRIDTERLLGVFLEKLEATAIR